MKNYKGQVINEKFIIKTYDISLTSKDIQILGVHTHTRPQIMVLNS